MKNRPRVASCFIVPLAATFLVGTCASPGDPGSERGASAGRDDVITLDEIDPLRSHGAVEVLRTVRPHWFRCRDLLDLTCWIGPRRIGERTGQLPALVIDNKRVGNMLDLTGVPMDRIVEIRFVSAAASRLRWGGGVRGGVLHFLLEN